MFPPNNNSKFLISVYCQITFLIDYTGFIIHFIMDFIDCKFDSRLHYIDKLFVSPPGYLLNNKCLRMLEACFFY